jgi:hypothetical protein
MSDLGDFKSICPEVIPLLNGLFYYLEDHYMTFKKYDLDANDVFSDQRNRKSLSALGV